MFEESKNIVIDIKLRVLVCGTDVNIVFVLVFLRRRRRRYTASVNSTSTELGGSPSSPPELFCALSNKLKYSWMNQ